MLKLNKKDYKKGIIKTALTSVLILSGYFYVDARYELCFDGQEGEKSTEYSVFIIDKWNKIINRNDYVAFESHKMKPYFPDNTLVVKQAKGLPGDKIVITDLLMINDEVLGQLSLLKRLNKTVLDYMRTETINNDQLFVFGISDRSYDSRYWGNIQTTSIIGRAYGIL